MPVAKALRQCLRIPGCEQELSPIIGLTDQVQAGLLLVPDCAYTFAPGRARFHRMTAPSQFELEHLLDTLIGRITRTLVRTDHNGITHVLFEPLDTIVRLTALVRRPALLQGSRLDSITNLDYSG